MKLLITGANGFLGRHVVLEALRRGHAVRAVVRPASDISLLPFAQHPAVEFARLDLRSSRGLAEACAGVDAVLHVAAAKAGDFYAQFAGTVIATENLLAAMDQVGVSHIVAVSSFSVYDYSRPRSFQRLDEDSPLEAHPADRDEYAQTKLIQEQLIRDHAQGRGWRWTILRPGVIFGPGNLWTARLGAQAGSCWIRIGGWATLPVTYVENCAEAIVLAAEHVAASGRIFNVVDDDLPTQRAYAAALRAQCSPRPRIVPVAWTLMRGLAGLAQMSNSLFFRGQAKVPGILVPARLDARCKPLRFTNQRLKQALGWKPRHAWREALRRSVSSSSGAPGMQSLSVAKCDSDCLAGRA